MKYILITGVSTGIGYATARYLLQQGYAVLGSVRKAADAERLSKELGPHFHPLVFNVTDTTAISEAVEATRTILGEQGLAGLVNNAGIAISGPLQHLPLSDFVYQFEVNVFGVLRVTQAFLPLLGAIPDRNFPPGKIINISSVSGKITFPFIGPYCASKFALESLSDALRRELLLYDIDVIVVQPGPIQTPIWSKARNKKAEFGQTIYGPILAQQKKLIGNTEKRAIPAIKVAQLIHKILYKSRPKTRYLILKNKVSTWLVSKLPDRLIDNFIKRELKKAVNFQV